MKEKINPDDLKALGFELSANGYDYHLSWENFYMFVELANEEFGMIELYVFKEPGQCKTCFHVTTWIVDTWANFWDLLDRCQVYKLSNKLRQNYIVNKQYGYTN